MEITLKKLDGLIGQRFGRLTVIERGTPPGKWKTKKYWVCRCDCGKITNVCQGSLVSRRSTSCGCFRKEFVSISKTTHGLNRTRTHHAWKNMKKRCQNPNAPYYKDYGGRGIMVCERWMNSFPNFVEDMGVCPNGLTIERIDVNGNYCPENCKWATPKEQANNTRQNIKVTHNGTTRTLKQWSEFTGIKYTTLYKRMVTKGWSAEKALNAYI